MTDTAIRLIRPGSPARVSVSKAGEVYIVSGEELERLVPAAHRELGGAPADSAILGGPRIRPRLERAA